MGLFGPKVGKLKSAGDISGLVELIVKPSDPSVRASAGDALLELAQSSESSTKALAEDFLRDDVPLGAVLNWDGYGVRLLTVAFRHPDADVRKRLAKRVVDSAGDITNYLSPVRILGYGEPEVEAEVQARFDRAFTAVHDEARRVLTHPLPWSSDEIERIQLLPEAELGDAAEVLLAGFERQPSSLDTMAWNPATCRLMVRAVEKGGERGEKAGARVLRLILGRVGGLGRGRERAGIAAMNPANIDIITEARSCLSRLEAKHGLAVADLQKDDVSTLIEKLDASQDARGNIAMELGKRGEAVAIAPLLDVLADAYNVNDRKAADRVMKALTSLGRAHPTKVASGLSHDVPEVRWAIAELLGDLRAGDALEALREATRDSDEGVREAAGVAIERIESAPPKRRVP